MPPKTTKTITKACPQCAKQVAVACKNCPCGHTFFQMRRSTQLKLAASDLIPSTSIDGFGRRRTERVKREKPDFYDASEYHKTRKPKIAKPAKSGNGDDDSNTSGTNPNAGEEGEKVEKKRGRKPGKVCNSLGAIMNRRLEKDRERDEDPLPFISPQKAAQLSLVLADINLKLQTVNPVIV